MLRQAKINVKIKPLEKDLKDMKNKQTQTVSEFKEKANQLLEDYHTRISNCQADIDKFKQEKEKLENEVKQNQLSRYNDFIEFRTTHYNEEMEMLLQKLNFNFLKVMDGVFEEQNGDIEEHVISNGTVKDYIKYIKNKMK